MWLTDNNCFLSYFVSWSELLSVLCLTSGGLKVVYSEEEEEEKKTVKHVVVDLAQLQFARL